MIAFALIQQAADTRPTPLPPADWTPAVLAVVIAAGVTALSSLLASLFAAWRTEQSKRHSDELAALDRRQDRIIDAYAAWNEAHLAVVLRYVEARRRAGKWNAQISAECLTGSMRLMLRLGARQSVLQIVDVGSAAAREAENLSVSPPDDGARWDAWYDAIDPSKHGILARVGERLEADRERAITSHRTWPMRVWLALKRERAGSATSAKAAGAADGPQG